MEDFETKTDEAPAVSETEENRGESRFQFRGLGRNILQKFVLFLSFGPGILGFLWLVSRILRR
jgi:hypothetical protein